MINSINFKMKNKSIKKFSIFLSLFFLFLTITKIDYRTLEPHPWSTHDDASYYFHAYTLGLDFDLDYSNQVSTESNFSILNDSNNPVPTHPFGSGLLSSPFVTLGNILNSLFDATLKDENNIIYFFYSMASIMFFFFTLFFIRNTLIAIKVEKIDSITVFALLLGSGLAYYAFERFSMTPVYEAFAVSLIMYLSTIEKRKIYFFVGFFTFSFLMIRWVNYYLILLPIFIFYLMNKKENIKKYLITNPYYFFGLISGLGLFLAHTKTLYNFVGINPSRVSNYAGPATNLIDKFLNFSNLEKFVSIETFVSILNDFTLILFSQEFGLAWFSPVLFMMFYIVMKLFFTRKYEIFFLILMIVSIPLGIVILWQSVASSYGYRYLFSLIPIAVLLSYKYLSTKEFKILTTLNVFSIFLYLMFETNELNSLREQINVFGVDVKYSARYYIQGTLNSVLDLDSYLTIIGTSFLAVIAIKFILIFIDLDTLLEFINNFGYLNDDVNRLINYSNNMSLIEIMGYLVMIFYFAQKLINQRFLFNNKQN